MVKIVSWNVARRLEPWRQLLDTEADLALLQEAAQPPDDVAEKIDVDPEPWITVGAGLNRRWRTAVVRLSNRVIVERFEPKSVEDAPLGELAVSRQGTVAAAVVTPSTGAPFTVVSLYAPWEKPHASLESSWIYADASVHRLISDLSVFVDREAGNRVLAAGDLNILYGYGEYGSTYWATRYNTVFSRMQAIGLPFVGPQAPCGRRAEPWPDELPHTSSNVPTFHTNRQTPATAKRQLDFVFASNSLAANVSVKALNEPEEWGPSDHCRIEIDIH